MSHQTQKSEQQLEKDTVDHETIAMVLSGVILIGGFFVIAFVSGPLGLFLTLLSLALTCVYYAIVGNKK